MQSVRAMNIIIFMNNVDANSYPTKILWSNRRSLSLSVLQSGEVVIKAPVGLPMTEIEKFVKQKERWIQSKLDRVNRVNLQNQDIINYQKVLVFGEKYSGYRTQKVKKITLTSKALLVPEKIGDEQLLGKIKSWYKLYAKKVLGDRLLEVSQHTHLTVAKFCIGDTRGRWGACYAAGKISLNWRVIMLPPNLIDYVIVHELMHLKEMNHSPAFWENVGKVLPEYKSLRQQIKSFGYLLQLF